MRTLTIVMIWLNGIWAFVNLFVVLVSSDVPIINAFWVFCNGGLAYILYTQLTSYEHLRKKR